MFSTVATANSPGYTEIFTPDYLTTNEKFYIMQTEGFVSEKTRAIFLEFTIYNFNLGLQLESGLQAVFFNAKKRHVSLLQ